MQGLFEALLEKLTRRLTRRGLSLRQGTLFELYFLDSLS